jgi:hypothetical protein
MNEWKKELGCECPEEAMMLIEYDMLHPEYYDGISEITCLQCGKRVGRWSGKVLKDDEYEKRFGKE